MARTGLAQPRVVASLVLALCVALLLAAATPASAITRKQASKKALAALGSKSGTDPVIVFGLKKPLRPGSRVTQTGSKKLVAKVGRERAFFFYEDSGPFKAYPHRGRVALVGVKSGKVRLSKSIKWAPRVNGKLPAFLKSRKLYSSAEYRVFYRSNEEPEATGSNDPFGPIALQQPSSSATADDQFVTVKQNSPKKIRLTGSDPDGDLLIFAITKQPNFGTISDAPPDITYTPNFGRLGPDHFFFTVTDGENPPSKEAKVTINVVPRGIPSTVMTSPGCTAYTEQSPGVTVDDQLTVFDPDDTVLDSARVRVAGFQFGDGDTLLFTDQNGITGSYSDFDGVLTLRGDASVADYEAALRSVQYRNLSDVNPPPTKDIEFTVNDAGGDSLPATKQICISQGDPGDNDPPIGETGEAGLSYTENDGPVPADGQFVVGDPDSANLSGATIKFIPIQNFDEDGNPTGPPVVTFDPAQDELAFTGQNGITGSYNDTTGVMTLSGTASLANYEAAIRSVTYENVSEDPTEDMRRLEFQVTDSGGASSTPSRRDIFITAINDAPVVTTSAGSTSYTENDPATPVDSGLTVIDVDNERPPPDDIEGAVVQATAGWTPAEDDLAFTNQNGITGVYDDTTGTLTLSGTSSVANYQAALRSITYVNNSENPSGATRSFEFKANDGELDSAPATKDVAVTPVNDAPVVTTTAGSTSYTENDPATPVDAGLTVADVDDTSLDSGQVRISSGFQSGDDLVFVDQNGITGVYNTGTGVLTLTTPSGEASLADWQTALRSIKYGHTGDNPSASKTIEFKVNDGDDDSAAATKDIAVTPVNDPPVLDATDTALAYSEGDGAVPVDDAIDVTDPDSATLSSASVTISSGYSAGEDVLAFTNQNGITGSLDESGDTLTLSGTASVADYQAALRSVTYENTSDTPSTTTRTLTFKANDGQLDANPVTRDITVTPVNDAPVVTTSAGDTAYTEGDPATTVDGALTVSDADDTNLESATVRISSGFQSGDDLVFVNQLGISGVYNTGTGVLTLTGTASEADYQTALRSIKFRHTGDNPSASKTIEFVANDGEDDSTAATKNIAVTPVNDAPVVTTSAGSTTYTIGGDDVAVDDALTVADADDTNLESAQIRISEGFESGDNLVLDEESLPGIAVDYNPGTGVMTLTGTASVADYQAALRMVAYRYTGETVPTLSKTVEFKANDGSADSNAATKSMTLLPAP